MVLKSHPYLRFWTRPLPTVLAGFVITAAVYWIFPRDRASATAQAVSRTVAHSGIASESTPSLVPAAPRQEPQPGAIPAPLTAAPWLELHPTERVSRISQVIRDTVRRSPETAVFDAIGFCEDDPSYSLEYGNALIAALGNCGDYAAALRFVLAEAREGDLGENGSKWLTTLFDAWARKDPRHAWETAETAIPVEFREEALQVVGAAWLLRDPSSLANFLSEHTSNEPPPVVRGSLASWVRTLGPDPLHAAHSGNLPTPD